MPKAPSLNDPLGCFIVGITGNMDPVGYDPKTCVCTSQSPEIHRIYVRVWKFIDWVFGKTTQCPIDSRVLSQVQPEASIHHRCELDPEFADQIPMNKCHFTSGELIQCFSCWRPLELKNTPLVLLSSLAPGIDTIVTEVFLDYKAANPQLPVFVRCPIPFEIDVLPECSSYSRPEDKKKLEELILRLRNQIGWDNYRDIFPVIVDSDWEQLRASEQSVSTASSVSSPEEMPTEEVSRQTLLRSELQAEITIDGVKNKWRHLKYRAAGEYVAAACNMLLAIYDYQFDKSEIDAGKAKINDPFSAGTHSIVEAKRWGLSWELLATSNNFSWADNGPVVRLGIERDKRKLRKGDEPIEASTEAWEFLQPYDLEPEEEFPSEDQKNAWWHAKGDFVFRRILELQDEFNRELIETPPGGIDPGKGKDELLRMIKPKSLVASEETNSWDFKKDLVGLEESFSTLAKAAHIRRTAGDLANKVYEPKRFFILIGLLVLVFLAASAIGMYGDWDREDSPVSLPVPGASIVSNPSVSPSGADEGTWGEIGRARIRVGLLFGCCIIVLSSWVWYVVYNAKRIEQKRFDYRALAEALRVQIYWCIAGLNRSVAHDYMQRQKDELDWIRHVTFDAAMPLERWSTFFSQLPNSKKAALLQLVNVQWVEGQQANAKKKCKELSHKIHLTHILCWGFACAGLLQLVLMLASDLTPEISNLIDSSHRRIAMFAFLVCIPGLLFLAAFCLNLAFLTVKGLESKIPKPVTQFSKWVDTNFGKHEVAIVEPNLARRIVTNIVHYWQILGVALLVGSIAMELTFHLPNLGELVPDRGNVWLIVTSASLILGALILSWGERRFYSEEYRNYSSMRVLYHAASKRLELIAKALKDQGEMKTWRGDRLLTEAHDILYQVGCEALNENAEWLILHRARPLEPLMTG